MLRFVAISFVVVLFFAATTSAQDTKLVEAAKKEAPRRWLTVHSNPIPWSPSLKLFIRRPELRSNTGGRRRPR